MANNEYEALLDQVPIGEIATRFGIDEGTARAAISQALPGLLGGLATNARSESGARSLESALGQHQREVRNLVDVDVDDGEKIVGHALGDKKEQVVSAVAGGNDDLVSKLLPLLAPIVMSFLAKRKTNAGGIGDLLGSILGGSSSRSGEGGLGGILGSILGNR